MSSANDIAVAEPVQPTACAILLQTTEVADAAYFMWLTVEFPVFILNLTFGT